MLKNRTKPKKSRQEINDASWELKRKRKHKGRPSGSRFNNGEQHATGTTHQPPRDPHIGSKKPISLIAPQPITANRAALEQMNAKASAPTGNVKHKSSLQPKTKLSPEQELAQLDDDPKLEQLLDFVEQGSKLTDEDQQYLNNKLDRIDQLMRQLGYLDDDDNSDHDPYDEPKEDIVSLLKRY
ncbi:Der GTPase-activating protein YihI [Orbaceae bacterium ESL0727]|nr:Der GTPase-activating protein YihI [Orbaceae bacterium ESL0727]